MFRSYAQYLRNPLVVFITASLTLSAVGAAFDDRLPSSDKTVGLSFAGSAFLSLFILFGLRGIKAESKRLHQEFLAEDVGLSNEAEKKCGSKDDSLKLANLGLFFSIVGLTMNTINLGIHFNKTKLDNPSAWGFLVLTLSTFANLLGFVLFNILGARNQAFFMEKHKANIASLKQTIQDLRDKPEKKAPIVAAAFVSGSSPVISPAAGVGALSSPRS